MPATQEELFVICPFCRTVNFEDHTWCGEEHCQAPLPVNLLTYTREELEELGDTNYLHLGHVFIAGLELPIYTLEHPSEYEDGSPFVFKRVEKVIDIRQFQREPNCE